MLSEVVTVKVESISNASLLNINSFHSALLF